MKRLAIVLLISLALPSHALERSFGTPKMKLVKETEMKGRKVLRFEHESIPEWGYNKPQTDYFYVLPLPKNQANQPLHVVLHSAGHSGDKVLADAFKHPDWLHYAGLADQTVIYLDCRRNKRSDWWWGAHAIKRGNGKYKDKYTPTEKRVLTTVEWAITTYKVDRNRVYLSGISMGGSGALGIGMCRGDIFATVNVAVPAGVDHIRARFFDKKIPDPPILINFSATNDGWSRGQEHLIEHFKAKKYALIFAWGPHGHKSPVMEYHPAALSFPWRELRKDQAYPVFSNTSTDKKYPGFRNALGGDKTGQIGALLRWKNIKDKADQFEMELRMVTGQEVKRKKGRPTEAQTDVSLRRLQTFKPAPGMTYSWTLSRDGKTAQAGKVSPGDDGLMTVNALQLSTKPARLIIRR